MGTKYKRRTITCRECGKEKPHIAHGFCGTCYQKPKAICDTCGEVKPHHAKGLCNKCYHILKRKGYKTPIIICEKCKRKRPNHGKLLCGICYNKAFKKTIIRCKTCQEFKPHHGHQRCKTCYERERYRKKNNITSERYRVAKPPNHPTLDSAKSHAAKQGGQESPGRLYHQYYSSDDNA
jgi:hypothetical protein